MLINIINVCPLIYLGVRMLKSVNTSVCRNNPTHIAPLQAGKIVHGVLEDHNFLQVSSWYSRGYVTVHGTDTSHAFFIAFSVQ